MNSKRWMVTLAVVASVGVGYVAAQGEEVEPLTDPQCIRTCLVELQLELIRRVEARAEQVLVLTPAGNQYPPGVVQMKIFEEQYAWIDALYHLNALRHEQAGTTPQSLLVYRIIIREMLDPHMDQIVERRARAQAAD